MKKYSIFLLLILFQLNLFSKERKDISIRLFATYFSDNTIITPVDGTFFLLSQNKDGSLIDTIAIIDADTERRTSFIFKKKNSQITISQRHRYLGKHERVLLKAKDKKSTFLIRYASLKERLYDGSINISNDRSNLKIINSVDIDSYVAGVVESEVGSSGNKEFYKVQAILARTYAIKNYNKFISEGFNLTDDVRSQVYLSKAYYTNYKMIKEAVEETKNLVIVDRRNSLIDPAFHANSGGETLNSGKVWINNVSYLKGRKDPYSLQFKGDSLYWKKKISKEKYLNFFYNKLPKYEGDKQYKKAVLNFKQDKRKATFDYKNNKIKLREIREEFGLKSTYFDVKSKNNFVILSGKGHGHGVGLSQMGAYKMAKNGFSYLEIIQFYYSNVDVIKFSEMKS